MSGARCVRALAGACALAAFLLAPAVEAASGDGEPPRALVEQAAGELMTSLVVRGDAIRSQPALARELAERTVFPLVDFRRIGRLVLGRHWRRATPEQRAAFLDAFAAYARDFLVTSLVAYSRDIARHADRVSFPPTPSGDDAGRATVRMRVRLEAGPAADVDFRMIRDDGGSWRIRDVVVEGVSMVLTYRRVFADQVRHHGLDGLIARLGARSPDLSP